MARAPNELTATEIVAGIEGGSLTCEAVVRACLERIEQREAEVGAWSHLDPEQSLATAREMDRGARRGPLVGVPFGVKDIIDTFDMPTEWGTTIHRGRQAGRDAACVALSRKAGGIMLGKAVTTEFANQHPGKTRNPLDVGRTPGGSSSGSAAAVADMMVPLAIGTQTTGSTIRPASFCGIFGYRPTYGEHRMHGVMEASGSFDTLGILARSIEDVALYRDVMLGIRPEPVATDVPPPRIGFARSHIWPKVLPTTQALVEGAAETLRRAGASVADVDLPEGCERMVEAHRWVAGFEFARTLTWEIENHWEKIGERTRSGRIADGLACPLERYVEMKQLVEQCQRRVLPLFEDYDVLLAPAATCEAPLGWDTFAGAELYKMWSALHLPALGMPVFRGPAGMPIGIQLFAAPHRDRALFAYSHWAWRHLH